jgi:non-heme chloroperoxidase
LKQVADHTTEVIRALDKKPAVMGHSTEGLLAQMLAGRGLSAVTVAIDPGVFRGLCRLRARCSRGRPVPDQPAHARPRNHAHLRQFKYGWANALDEQEAKKLYDKYHVAGSGIALAQMGNANLNPATEAKVDTKNPDRGPLLIIDGDSPVSSSPLQGPAGSATCHACVDRASGFRSERGRLLPRQVQRRGL